jgi:hypothetical protein
MTGTNCDLFTHKSVPVIFEPPCTFFQNVRFNPLNKPIRNFSYEYIPFLIFFLWHNSPRRARAPSFWIYTYCWKKFKNSLSAPRDAVYAVDTLLALILKVIGYFLGKEGDMRWYLSLFRSDVKNVNWFRFVRVIVCPSVSTYQCISNQTDFREILTLETFM